jgi:hypothetical protein
MIRLTHVTLSVAAVTLAGIGMVACISGGLPSQNQANPDGSTSSGSSGGASTSGASGGTGSSGASSGGTSSSGDGGGSSSGDAGGSSTGTSSGASSSGDGGGGSGGSSGGDGGNPCVDPQLTFGNIGQGDTNQYFTLGVGARTATDLLIFSGYLGPDPAGDGGGANVELVYLQAFDATTAVSKGPATKLFVGPDPNGGNDRIIPRATAVAPTGQIALVYTDSTGLYAAFLESAADGGVPALTLLTNVQIARGGTNNVDSASVHVIWSSATVSFVVSWVGTNYVESIAKYTATGGQTAGGVSAVTTDNGVTADDTIGQASAGVSGSLVGIEWGSGLAPPATSLGLTVYNSLGDQVGGPTYLASGVTSSAAGLATLAGTAQGFVCVYCPFQTNGAPTTMVFAPTTDTGLADAGAYPTRTISALTTYYMRAISDDVGIGGAGGVGVGLMNATSTSFAYVHADGVTVDGPVTVFGTGYTSNGGTPWLSLTNINGSFVATVYDSNSGSTQIAASGCN